MGERDPRLLCMNGFGASGGRSHEVSYSGFGVQNGRYMGLYVPRDS